MKSIVYVIYGECKNDYTINSYFENIKSKFHGSEFWQFCIKKVNSCEEFENEFDKISNLVSNGDNLYLDIHCHGNSYGLSLSDGMVSWNNLCELCHSIDTGFDKKITITLFLSSCFSIGFAAYLHNYRINDVCSYLLCTSNIVEGRFVTETAEQIFDAISNGVDIIHANDTASLYSYKMHNDNPNYPVTLYELFIFTNSD